MKNLKTKVKVDQSESKNKRAMKIDVKNEKETRDYCQHLLRSVVF